MKPTSNTCLWVLWLIALSVLLASGCSSMSTARHLKTGDRQMQEGDYAAAAQSYQKSLDKQKDDSTALKLALAQSKAGDYSASLKTIKETTVENSSDGAYIAAMCYVRSNDLANAQRMVESSLQADPTNSLTLALLGRIRFLQKQYPQSAEAYQNALQLSSEESIRTQLRYNLAMAYLLDGKFEAADKYFQQYLVRQNFVSAEDNHTAGTIAYAVGDHQRAFRHWSQLTSVQKKQILEVITDESDIYQKLANAQ